jgi:NAD(P)H-dependent flavin oxidoreductase YrpB (nitropropane dioxygenase family)
MKWKTKITQILGIKYPLVMGAFGGWGKAEFASSFSKAGGLGIIAALNFPNPEDFRKDLQKMKELTDKPFGINLSLPHRSLKENGEDIETIKRYLDYVEIAINENCTIFTTSGYKASFIGTRVHEADGLWFHKCVLVKHAIAAEKAGADGYCSRKSGCRWYYYSRFRRNWIQKSPNKHYFGKHNYGKKIAQSSYNCRGRNRRLKRIFRCSGIRR